MQWVPKAHDPLLKLLHRMKLTVYEMQDHMKEYGQPFSGDCIRAQMRRLGLKAHTKPLTGKVAHPTERNAPYKDKPNPLAEAYIWLGKRLREKDGGFYLDGSPAGLRDVMRELNRVLKASGVAQVGPEHWKSGD